VAKDDNEPTAKPTPKPRTDEHRRTDSAGIAKAVEEMEEAQVVLVKLDRAERRKVLALAQRREIDVVLVTELSRWGRSTTDLLATLKELEARRVSLMALNEMGSTCPPRTSA
jgi:DNA invertase Pin-like site-specific DNA recombinase